MTLIKSISGIRGTIGGSQGDNLTPFDIQKFVAAYALFIKEAYGKDKVKIIVGRDARISGEMVANIAIGTLMGMGADVVDLGMATTPTVEVAVPDLNADGGIIFTASHNPKQWNALKLLNAKGEFLSGNDGERILALAETEMTFSDVDSLGKVENLPNYLEKHIDMIKALPLVDVEAIGKKKFKVVVDAVNSIGGIAVPALLKSLGVDEVININGEPNGEFAHNPEPLPENLGQIMEAIKAEKADLGIVVDPDVDRLALVSEDGSMFGEEYTLVAVADYVLAHTKGNTVSNLSSTKALRDVTEQQGGEYFAAAVGEVNVVEKMKEHQAVIGGEGNGGVIYPELHYGRDALVGIGLFLSHLAHKNSSMTELRASYPNYFISKNKMELTADIDVDALLNSVEEKFKDNEVLTIDGVKVHFDNEWVHLRKSNTEPIIRIYSESSSEKKANDLAEEMISEINNIIG